MSLDALIWALRVRKQGAVDDSALRTLAILADFAGPKPEFAAWPTWDTLQEDRGVSRATIARHLKALYEAGLILPGSARHVAQLPGNKRPKVWCMNVDPRGLTYETPGDAKGLIDPPLGVSSGETQNYELNRESKSGVSPRAREAHEWDRPDVDCVHGAACVTYVDSRSGKRGPRCAECRKAGRYVLAQPTLDDES